MNNAVSSHTDGTPLDMELLAKVLRQHKLGRPEHIEFIVAEQRNETFEALIRALDYRNSCGHFEQNSTDIDRSMRLLGGPYPGHDKPTSQGLVISDATTRVLQAAIGEAMRKAQQEQIDDEPDTNPEIVAD